MPSIPYNDRSQTVTPASSTDSITLDFPIASTDDLKVTVNDVETIDYVVTATFVDGMDFGATLSIITPVVSNPTVKIIGDRRPRRTQFTVSSGHELVAKINAEVAQRTIEIQELDRRLSSVSGGLDLPPTGERANKYFGWDGNGDPDMRFVAASEVTYDNSSSGLSATEVQDALDELASDAGQCLVSINTQTGTSYTLAEADAGNIVEMDNAGANTVTIPEEATVNFSVGTIITLTQKGAGTTTVTAATGVTVNGVSAGSAALNAQWDGASLYKRASNEWVLQGAHGGVS